MDNYLKIIGLENLINKKREASLNNFVDESFALSKKDFSEEELKKLYTYDVPVIGPDNACSATNQKEDKPYNLADILGSDSFTSLRLWRLNQVVQKLYELTRADWLGIYRRVKNKNGQEVLLKEAYRGAFSRAEFPLTKDFAEHSNNSTVGLSGKAVLVQDVALYSGPYYQCDAKVQSEFCIPILNKNNHVVGIIDAESFKEKYFTPEIMIQITKVCMDLGGIYLGVH